MPAMRACALWSSLSSIVHSDTMWNGTSLYRGKDSNEASANAQRAVKASFHAPCAYSLSKRRTAANARRHQALVGCDYPLRVFRSASQRTSTGKPAITFNPVEAMQSTGPINIPCGNCVGCKLDYARQWRIRMVHESKLHQQNSFLTLTYDNQHVPTDYSVSVRDFQLFMKRLRKALGKTRIRFFACGEYGDLNGRPHYHAIIFGWDPPDKKLITSSKSNKPQYQSRVLDDAWQNGSASSQSVTPDSCGYVARYCVKKIKTNDDFGRDRYYRLSPVDGQFYSVRPEFALMSRRPGIGHSYTDRFKGDYFPSGFIVMEGKKEGLPRYYRSQLTEEEQKKLTNTYRSHAQPRSERTMERKEARAAVRDDRIKSLKRML